jgi:Spy/CpxP family protein refolding chaperone
VNNWKVILATMVIFGTGVVTGGLLVRHGDHRQERRPQRAGAGVHPAQAGPAGVMRIEFLRRMERELDLTPAQREPVDLILKNGQERMKKLMDTVEPRRREEFKKTVEEFRAVLTPEQRQRFDALVKQQQQRVREQRKATPPRDHPQQSPPPGNTPAATNP